MAIQTEKPIECVGCNTFDMKSLFDNRDCSQVIEYVYDSEEQAQEALAFFTQKARDVESEPKNKISRKSAAYFSAVFLTQYAFEKSPIQLGNRK